MWGSLRRSGVVGVSLLGCWLLTPGEALATFPGDNGLIAFHNDTLGGIYTINSDGSGRDRIDADGFEPSWSPNGKRIAFAGEAPGGSFEIDIFTMKANGNDKRRITRTDKNEWEPAWSPEGEIVFRRGQFRNSGEGKLFAIDLETGKERKLRKGARPDWSAPRIGAQGGRIAFSNFTEDEDCGLNTHLFTSRPSGAKPRIMDFNCQTTTHPSWHPEARQLAARSNGDVYISDPGGDGPIRMTDLPETDDAPAWSPDGSQIVFGNGGLRRVAVAAPLAESVIPNTADVDGGQPSWQPWP